MAGQPASPDEHAESDLDLLDDEYDDEYYAAEHGDLDAEPEGSAFDSMLSSSHDRDESRPRRRRPMWGGWALLAILLLLMAGGGVWLTTW